jgi:hypothetical protein
MTQQELDGLPEMTEHYVLWQNDSDPTSITDSYGITWMVGWWEGKQYKRKMW